MASLAARLRHFAQATLRGRALYEPPIAPPIFIGGCGHSGTTLLLAMLAAHSRIWAVPYETRLVSQGPARIQEFVRSFNRDTAAAGKARWVLKTPRQILDVQPLSELFPDARFILLLRDGRDVAVSIRDRTGDFEAGVRRWVEDNAAGEASWGDESVFVLRYEDLVEDSTAALTATMEALGETFEPAMLRHHEGGFRFLGQWHNLDRYRDRLLGLDGEKPPDLTPRSHRLYRSWQARQPLFDGRGRWRGQLSEDEKALFKRIGGEALIRYGYASDYDW